MAWDIKELERINETGRTLIIDCDTLKDKLLQPGYNRIAANFARQLRCFQDKATDIRTLATHILVVMISPEDRNRKPYAIPVQCLAYTFLIDGVVRRIFDALIKEMVHRDMTIAGKKFLVFFKRHGYTNQCFIFIHHFVFIHLAFKNVLRMFN